MRRCKYFYKLYLEANVSINVFHCESNLETNNQGMSIVIDFFRVTFKLRCFKQITSLYNNPVSQSMPLESWDNLAERVKSFSSKAACHNRFKRLGIKHDWNWRSWISREISSALSFSKLLLNKHIQWEIKNQRRHPLLCLL